MVERQENPNAQSAITEFSSIELAQGAFNLTEDFKRTIKGLAGFQQAVSELYFGDKGDVVSFEHKKNQYRLEYSHNAIGQYFLLYRYKKLRGKTTPDVEESVEIVATRSKDIVDPGYQISIFYECDTYAAELSEINTPLALEKARGMLKRLSPQK